MPTSPMNHSNDRRAIFEEEPPVALRLRKFSKQTGNELRAREIATSIIRRPSLQLPEVIRDTWPLVVDPRPINASKEVVQHVNVQTRGEGVFYRPLNPCSANLVYG